MQELFFINSVEHFSYVAIFLFTIFAGYIVPVPEEIVLLIVGYMASVDFIHFAPALVVVILALLIGDNIIFNLSLKNNKHVHKLIHEVLSLKIVSRNRGFLEKHVGKTIFFSRFFPFLRFVGPVLAGYTKAKTRTFQFYNTLAIIIYAPLVIGIGYIFNNYFDWIIDHIDKMRHVIVILIWIIVGLVITRIVDYIFRKVNPCE
ncbi:MAG: DedA family protein [Candidatus Paceibacterota bacterium]|jgi:membrane protein DedA with SNARE-associated domain